MPSIVTTRPDGSDGLAVEAWGQGLMVGSLIVMIAVTVANMKRKSPLHGLIAAELVLAIPHGTFIFLHDPAYGWYLSTTAIGLNISWSLHNLISWMKTRAFYGSWGTWLYMLSLLAAQPYWIVEVYANFAFFNHGNPLFLRTRPLEPLFRDPWWIFNSCYLFYIIQRSYECRFRVLVRVSPRFGVMILFMVLSIIFTIVDTCAVVGAFHLEFPLGVEPFWKLAFIFKCLSDTIILDDFGSALDQVRQHYLSQFRQLEEIELRSFGAEDLPRSLSVERPAPVYDLQGSGWYYDDPRA